MSNPSPAKPELITLEPRGHSVIVVVNGDIHDDDDMKKLAAGVEQASAQPDVTTIVLDLSKVKVVPSLGLGAIIQLSAKCKGKKQKLRLAAMLPVVRQTFTITRLDKFLDIVPTVEAALE